MNNSRLRHEAPVVRGSKISGVTQVPTGASRPGRTMGSHSVLIVPLKSGKSAHGDPREGSETPQVGDRRRET
jgi:hypothetical protein